MKDSVACQKKTSSIQLHWSKESPSFCLMLLKTTKMVRSWSIIAINNRFVISMLFTSPSRLKTWEFVFLFSCLPFPFLLDHVSSLIHTTPKYHTRYCFIFHVKHLKLKLTHFWCVRFSLADADQTLCWNLISTMKKNENWHQISCIKRHETNSNMHKERW